MARGHRYDDVVPVGRFEPDGAGRPAGGRPRRRRPPSPRPRSPPASTAAAGRTRRPTRWRGPQCSSIRSGHAGQERRRRARRRPAAAHPGPAGAPPRRWPRRPRPREGRTAARGRRPTRGRRRPGSASPRCWTGTPCSRTASANSGQPDVDHGRPRSGSTTSAAVRVIAPSPVAAMPARPVEQQRSGLVEVAAAARSTESCRSRRPLLALLDHRPDRARRGAARARPGRRRWPRGRAPR